MTTWRTVSNTARYHLVQWPLYAGLPWGVMAFSFAVNLIVATQTPVIHTGGLVTIYVWVFIGGLFSTYRSLPFGLALGASRSSYYLAILAPPVWLSSLPPSTGSPSPVCRPSSGPPADGAGTCTSSGWPTSSGERGTSPG